MHLSNVCVFCGSSEFISFKAQNFEYLQCKECSSIAIVDVQVPKYDNDYYSFSSSNYRLNVVELFFIKIKGYFPFILYPLLCGFTRRGLGPWIGMLSKKVILSRIITSMIHTQNRRAAALYKNSQRRITPNSLLLQ
jgi:hypothetical protein